MDASVVLAAAEAAHEANRIYCEAIGDSSQVGWKDAEPWQRAAAVEGITAALGGAGPEALHETWAAALRLEGWSFGKEKSAIYKTHPCLVPYGDLSAEQRGKDILYGAVARGMVAALEEAAR